ncbi:MAG: formate/nitrite transporter family protein, partial [Actinomycetota bacterium]|nr:formate/nitrite transporter family protein [Actinomycetota bacterium]
MATGTVGGLDLGLGILGLLIVRHATGSRQLGALAFSIGFIALVLAKSELFTENFLVPVTAVVARNASWWSVGRLWAGTAATNLAGGWLMMGIVIGAVPRLRETAVQEVSIHFIELGIGWTSFSSAVLAGTIMT